MRGRPGNGPGTKAAQSLRELFFQVDPKARSRRVEVMGWHDHGQVFVTPAWTIPDKAHERIRLEMRAGSALLSQGWHISGLAA